MAWSNVLVPYDFSDCSQRALRTAMQLVHGGDAVVHVVHVAQVPANLRREDRLPPDHASGATTVGDYLAAETLRALEESIAPQRSAGTPKITLRVLFGDAVVELRKLSQDPSFDAVVMGTHGRTGLAHLILGSVAESLVRTSPIPVVTLRGTCAAPESHPGLARLEDELAG